MKSFASKTPEVLINEQQKQYFITESLQHKNNKWSIAIKLLSIICNQWNKRICTWRKLTTNNSSKKVNTWELRASKRRTTNTPRKSFSGLNWWIDIRKITTRWKNAFRAAHLVKSQRPVKLTTSLQESCQLFKWFVYCRKWFRFFPRERKTIIYSTRIVYPLPL